MAMVGFKESAELSQEQPPLIR